MPYSKTDMYYQSYKWSVYATVDPKISGRPNNVVFNREQGYEVLYMINYLLTELNVDSKSIGQRIEKFIKTDLPYNQSTQKEVESWIKKYLTL
jgi:hypothetical protein